MAQELEWYDSQAANLIIAWTKWSCAACFAAALLLCCLRMCTIAALMGMPAGSQANMCRLQAKGHRQVRVYINVHWSFLNCWWNHPEWKKTTRQSLCLITPWNFLGAPCSHRLSALVSETIVPPQRNPISRREWTWKGDLQIWYKNVRWKLVYIDFHGFCMTCPLVFCYLAVV